MTTLGTGIIDPPWAYARTSDHEKLRGYSTGHEYESLSTEDLCKLPIKDLMSYGFLWTTGPFMEDAYRMVREWGMQPITLIYWVKTVEVVPGGDAFPLDPQEAQDPKFKPTYGCGYWFRGCVEPILVFKDPKAKSVKSAWVGLLSPNARHSRKPDNLHQIIETDYPGPFIELFGRRDRENWTVLGNQAPGDGKDIRVSIQEYLDVNAKKIA